MGVKNWWGSRGSLKPEGVNYEDTPYVLRFRKNTTRWVLFTIVMAVIALLAGSVIATNPGREIRVFRDGEVLNPPSLSALAVGCTGIMDIPEPPQETFGVVEEPTPGPTTDDPFWYSIPPVSGNFYHPPYVAPPEGVPFLENPLAGETPNLGEAVALLYRGWVVVWYRSSVVEQSEVELFRNSITTSESLKDRTIIAPWPYENDVNWTGSRPWVYTAWGSWQKCEEVSRTSLEDFQEDTSGKAPGDGLSLTEEPPPAQNKNADFPSSVVKSGGNF